MKILISVLLLTIAISCTPSKTTKYFVLFKREILSARLNTFEKYLPEKFENRLLARIQYAFGYKTLGRAGINVLFELDDKKFQVKKKELINANILTNINLSDTCFKNVSEEIFDYDCDKEISLKMPNMLEYYCQEGGFCFNLKDFDITVLEFGVGDVYSNKVSKEYLPDKQLHYVVGAYISKSKNYINYWFFIY